MLFAPLVLMMLADSVTVVHAKDVESQLKTPPAQLAHGDNYTVMTMRRTAAGQVEVHDKDTDVVYVIDGAATVTTGGTVVDAKVTSPGETRGSSIKGGAAHHIAKGDVMTIPKGVPHWFSAVDGTVTYFVVKVR